MTFSHSTAVAASEAAGSADLARLVELARDKSSAGRSALVSALGDLFIDGGALAATRERDLINDILRRLVSDVEATVRRAVAERLAERGDAPRELIMMLAHDEADVAFPLLARSAVLQDTDLIAIVRQRTVGHRSAIAARTPVSESISAALVEFGEESVLTALLDNKHARISPQTFESIVDLSRTLDSLQEPLLDRRDLPVALAGKMYWWVSAALRLHILDHFDIDPTSLDDVVERAVGSLVPHTNHAKVEAPTQLREESDRLVRTKSVTPALLIDLLRKNQAPLFEVLLAQMTGLRMTFLRRLFYQPGGQALAIALRAIGIEKSDFASILIWSWQCRRGDKYVDPRELRRVLMFFDRIEPKTANSILRRWQRDPDYLNAIQFLEGEGSAQAKPH